MTEKERRSHWWTKILFPLALIAIIATPIAVASTAVKVDNRAAESRAQVDALNRNHDSTVCIMGMFHGLSQSSGASPEERAATFQASFAPERLRTTCGLSDDEIAVVLAPIVLTMPGTSTTTTTVPNGTTTTTR